MIGIVSGYLERSGFGRCWFELWFDFASLENDQGACRA